MYNLHTISCERCLNDDKCLITVIFENDLLTFGNSCYRDAMKHLLNVHVQCTKCVLLGGTDSKSDWSQSIENVFKISLEEDFCYEEFHV